MQFVQKVKEGLKREVQVVIPAQEITQALDEKVAEAKSTYHVQGFRPGKVPESHLRKTYGKRFLLQILNDKLQQILPQLVKDTGENLALTPEFDFDNSDEILQQLLKGETDYKIDLKYEVLPEIELKDLSGAKIEREIVEVSDEEVKEQVKNILSSNTQFTEKDTAAKNGYRITLDYEGRIEDKPFKHGAAKEAQIIIGSQRFIPGFEEQLVGLKAGDKKVIKVTFPAEYQASDLAGQEADFHIEVHKVEQPEKLVINDEAAKKLGVESLAKLEEMLKSELENRYGSITREKLKRKLLDLVDKEYNFDLPQTLVDKEYDSLILEAKRYEPNLDLSEGSKDSIEYKSIAARRVKAALVFSKIGKDAKIDVSTEELNKFVLQQMQYYPGREKEIISMLQKDPSSLESFRLSIFHDKVVDYILSSIKLKDKIVTVEELTKEDDEASKNTKSPASKKRKSAESKKTSSKSDVEKESAE